MLLPVNNMIAREPAGVGQSARASVEKLFQEGAIVTLAAVPAVPFLLGDMQWLEPGRILLFPAYGDAPTDARLLGFDRIIDGIDGESSRICFLRAERLAATITRIEQANVDDPDDYRIAWQLWQQVVPLRRDFIERCYEALEQSAGPHAGVA